MNPRQRRGALLIALSAVGAVAVFVMVANYVADVRAEVGPVTEAVALADGAAAHEPITGDMLERMEVPERWMPAGAVTDPAQAVGRVAPSDLPSGTLLQEGMLVDPPEIDEGGRELAILVDAETGVGGKIGPGSTVDVVGTFTGDDTGDDQAPRQSVYALQNLEIIEVGSPQDATEEGNAPGFATGDVVPITFSLNVKEALQLAYVETFADNVRLALRSPLDDVELDEPLRRYAPEAGEEFDFDLGPPDLPTPDEGDAEEGGTP